MTCRTARFDWLLRLFAGDWVAGMLKRLGLGEGEAISSRMISRRLEHAQHRIAHTHGLPASRLIDVRQLAVVAVVAHQAIDFRHPSFQLGKLSRQDRGVSVLSDGIREPPRLQQTNFGLPSTLTHRLWLLVLFGPACSVPVRFPH